MALAAILVSFVFALYLSGLINLRARVVQKEHLRWGSSDVGASDHRVLTLNVHTRAHGRAD